MGTCRTLVLTWAVMMVAVMGCSGANESSSGTDGGTDSDSETYGTDDTDEDCDWSTVFADFFTRDHVIDVSIDFDDPGAFEEMLADKMSGEYYPATVTIDGEAMANVGVRFKGNSSLMMSEDDNTKSFKLHFEQYVDGQRFHCIDRLNLNNAMKDPSMLRETLGYDLARTAGIVTPHTSFAEVTVDGELHGLFTMAQQVDHRFLKENYGTEDGADDGNLYKLYSSYDFSYLGESATPADYGDPVEETGLVLKTNEDDDDLNDFSDVTSLTRAIDAVLQDPGEENRAALETVMDLDSYLLYQAWTLVIANLDAYYALNHNLYIYHNPVTGLFETIPWDVNMAFGSFECGGGMAGPENPPDTSGQTVYDVDLLQPCGREKPLNRLSYEVPEYRARYCDFLDLLVGQDGEGLYTVADQDEQIADLAALADEARQRMDEEAVLTQPPGDYNYEEYIHGLGHDSTPAGDSGPSPTPNLGYFNDQRLINLTGLIELACQ